MNKKTSRLRLRVAGSLLLAAMLTESLWAEDSFPTTNSPVTIRQIKRVAKPTAQTIVRELSRASTDIASTNKEPVAETVLFSVTNHTDRTLLLWLPTIEVKAGSDWITQAGPFDEFIELATAGSTVNTRHLKPHQAADFTLHLGPVQPGVTRVMVGCGVNWLATQPPGKAWRLRVSVQDVLTGVADASRRAREVGAYVKGHLTGNTNQFWNSPFSKSTSYLGNTSSAAVSDEVSVR